MKIDTLNEYVVFSKHLNFSTAAKELYISQPGLSIHMSNLEKELGFLLIDRTGDLRLTPAGLIFLDCAQDILDRYRDGINACKSVSEAPPFVRLLAAPDNADFLSLVSDVKEIPFTFVDNDPDSPVLYALEKNLLDIGFCVDFSSNPDLTKMAARNHIASLPFARFPVSIALMRTHPLASQEGLSRSDFENASIVINSGTHYDSWKAVVQSFFGESVPLRFRLDPIGSIANLAIADFGESIHICGGKANENYLSHREDVVIFDSLDGEPVFYDSVIVYRTDNPNKNVHAFIGALEKALDGQSKDRHRGHEAPEQSGTAGITGSAR
ncbi:MAG: LysR family transcriptional regulator [Coriobacteriaceae bacterium]|jgi:DNA-binding transcriptional LysR family regulator|nr:LysR family transcriptional regulator [Coriobacteriaceae bacterium]